MSDVDGLEARRAWLDLRQATRCEHREKWDAEYRGLIAGQVAQTKPPSMSVYVTMGGLERYTLIMPVADPVNPRIDTVCAGKGKLQVVTGIPSARPFPMPAPEGYDVIAHITVPAGATNILAKDIQ